MAANAIAEPETLVEEELRDASETSCCVVGGGPAGVMLSLLLARRGVRVMLLEAHKDFEREFRGDTVHPSTIEILDEIGLSERFLRLPHVKAYSPNLRAANGSFNPIDIRRLKIKFPFIAIMHQPIFLDFVTREAKNYPNFELRMTANVLQLIEEGGEVCGVRYQGPEGWHEVRAQLVVGADGRFSRVRQLAGIVPVKTSPPMDVIWFRLPKLPSDPPAEGGLIGGFGAGHLFIAIDRHDYWQMGIVIFKGSYQEFRSRGPEELRRVVAEIDPRFAPNAEYFTDWRQASLLSVESSRCPVWHRPGLLLIGDAAHVMSPIGGVGINYAVQDAVVAANVLARPLLAGKVTERDLAEVQRRRVWPTRVIQAFQSFAQENIVLRILRSRGPLVIPWSARLFFSIPWLRDLPARLIAVGIRRVHVEN